MFTESVTAVLTFILAMTIFTVVCLPMNNRSTTEKMFMLCIGISILAAMLDRISHIFSAYDTDGSVSNLAEMVISISRSGAIMYGIAWCFEWLYSKKKTDQTVTLDIAPYAVHRKSH